MKFSLYVLVLLGLGVECKLLGGVERVDVNDQDLNDIVSNAVDAFNEKSNDLYLHKFQILDATRQVVSGMRYVAHLLLQKTTCKKNDVELDDCELNTEAPKSQYCTFKIWARSWLEQLADVSYDCCDVDKPTCNYEMPNSNRATSRNLLSLYDFEKSNHVGDYFRKNEQSRPKINFFENEDLKYMDDFENFRKTYNKVYDTDEEYKKRYLIFSDNVARAQRFQDTEQSTAKYGVTQFMDLTEAEFSKYYLSPVWKPTESSLHAELAVIPDIDIPDSFDWRDKGAVTAVKNQGSCGSCWAFSTTGNIEGQVFLASDKLLSLSEQELVDCDKIDEGCNGGLPSNAYEQIIQLGGLMSESNYPYEGEDEPCHFSKAEVVAQISGYVNISQDETDIAKYLVANGPISIGINANAMQFYFGGISYPWKLFCWPTSLDHGVLIVGYGVEDDTPFWIIKNSWGPTWGEDGYYRVYRGAGVCGLNQMCTSAYINK